MSRARVAALVPGFGPSNLTPDLVCIGWRAGEEVDCEPGPMALGPDMILGIRHHAPEADIVVISLQDRPQTATHLAEGIDLAVQRGCRVICLPLSTGVTGASTVKQACERAAAQGALVVSGKYGPAGSMAWPGALPFVAGITPLHEEPDVIRWISDEAAERIPELKDFVGCFATSGAVPGASGSRHGAGAIGVALMGGYLARGLEQHPGWTPAELLDWARQTTAL